ncbi:uncharacterized protein LOC129597313 isoform X4 [Paramacrobiotus metropolitanus]|uniref:uncharacterized protein LOC129597313 isoform X4 n=1 Tax=Paramacrobiotus metropolitanus TaxID=2943436 RepID=UPI002445ABE8|nr:uncharacterized protein LOC129597313 isoform X4 [Paramacrobiotus metropolitanus]
MAGKYLYATNFEQKFSNGFTVYQIKLEERATTTQENGFLQLSHNDDFENGEFDNFEENIEVGCTYELLAKPAKRTDSKTEMEQLRLSILPLITAFTTDMDGTSINVQRYYGIDYTVPKAGIPRICYILAENCEGSPARYQVSKDEFRLAVIVNGFPQPTDSQYESFAKGVPYGHFTSRRELGMFLANILHESAGLRYRKEISPQPEYGKYYGRGYMQLTWEDNYRKASQALYHDDRLVENPDQVADDEDVAWATACWYWGAVVHSYPGVAEGKFGASIRAINSEEEGMGRNEVKSRARNEYYKRILAVFVPGEAPVESGS